MPLAQKSWCAAPDYALSDRQTEALDQHILPYLTTGFSCLCLEGQTGSGKTEVYLQAAQAVLLQGKRVLILVPEIALMPQTIRRIQQRFGDIVAYYHSGIASQEPSSGSPLTVGQSRLLSARDQLCFCHLPVLA